jgi:hypothetical protein
MCKCVLPPGVNPTAVDKYINININKINFRVLVLIEMTMEVENSSKYELNDSCISVSYHYLETKGQQFLVDFHP